MSSVERMCHNQQHDQKKKKTHIQSTVSGLRVLRLNHKAANPPVGLFEKHKQKLAFFGECCPLIDSLEILIHEDHKHGQVDEKQKKLKFFRQKYVFGYAFPIDRPYVEELSTELERAMDVGDRMSDEKRNTQNELRQRAITRRSNRWMRSAPTCMTAHRAM
jgi:hypothetical protein